jgi:hypothetical protein
MRPNLNGIGILHFWSLKDTFQVVQINDSILQLSAPNAYSGTSIKIKVINNFGLDSLLK